MEIIKIRFGHYVGKYASCTEFPRIFCAGIGPLQLGVVLVELLSDRLNGAIDGLQ